MRADPQEIQRAAVALIRVIFNELMSIRHPSPWLAPAMLYPAFSSGGSQNQKFATASIVGGGRGENVEEKDQKDYLSPLHTFLCHT